MECRKTDSLQHCQQYRLRLTLVHLLELPARDCNLVSKKLISLALPLLKDFQNPRHFRRLASDAQLLLNFLHSEVLNLCSIKKKKKWKRSL